VRQLAAVGLRPDDLAEPDGWVRAAAVARLLDRTAAESGHEDVGLMLARRRRLSTLGPLSVVLREEPDLRSALVLLVRYERSLNEAMRLDLSERHGLATVSTWLEFGEPAPVRQALELTLGALVGFVRALRRPGWQPRSVHLGHPAPAGATLHRRLLGPAVRFDEEFTGLVFSARELDSPNPLAVPSDPQLRTYTRQFLRSLPAPRETELADRIRELVQALLPVGRCTMPRVARALGTTPRTLHRYLAADGETFAGIVDATRGTLAERYLATGHHSLTEIAYLLGFSAPSAFSRWFRRRFGCSPTAWRAGTRLFPDSPHAPDAGDAGPDQWSSSTESTLPAGSVNQAMSGPPARMMPFSSVGGVS
jgi:AraC-like DNA-binding protein